MRLSIKKAELTDLFARLVDDPSYTNMEDYVKLQVIDDKSLCQFNDKFFNVNSMSEVNTEGFWYYRIKDIHRSLLAACCENKEDSISFVNDKIFINGLVFLHL